MATRALPVVAAFLLAVGCAHAPAATAPAPDWGIARASTTDTFEIGGQADHWGVRVTNDEILGVQPDFALSRTDGEIRGRAVGSRWWWASTRTRARASTVVLPSR